MMRKHTAVLGWCLALLVSAGFAALGYWQLQRMHSKQALLEHAAHVREMPLTLVQALATPHALAWASGDVRFLPQQVLLDNQLHAGRAGVRVYQLAAPQGSAGTLLIELGWLPLPANRQLPTITPLHGTQAMRGYSARRPRLGLRSAGNGPRRYAADLAGHTPGCAGPAQCLWQARHFVAGVAAGSGPTGRLRARSGDAAEHAATRAALGLCGAMVRSGRSGIGHRDVADMACASPPSTRALTPAA